MQPLDESQSASQPGDPRRRRRSGAGSERPRERDREPNTEAQPAPDPAEDVVLSRTLFSFFEPALNVISSFSLPMVIAGVVGLVAGATVLAFVSSMRDPYGWIVLWFSIGLLVVVALNSLSTVVAAFISRTGRYGVNTLIMTSAFTGIVVVVAIVGFENTQRIDLTATNQFSLSNRTKQLLGDLEQPIRATAFYKDTASPGNAERVQRRIKVEDTLKEFDARTNKFTYRIVDPDFNPEVATQYFGARPVNFVAESIVVENLETETIDVVKPEDDAYSKLEQKLVTSMLVAAGFEQKSIYFLTGHGERLLNSSAADGYSSLKDGLEQDNYKVEPLIWNVARDDVSVPEDTDLLVIGRPTGDLPESHAEALHLFLRGKRVNEEGQTVDRRAGGRMMFLADVDTPDSFKEFLIRWGIGVQQGYIRDVESSVPQNPQMLRLTSYNPEAPVDVIFPRGVPLDVTFMPTAAPLVLVDDGLRVHLPLAITSVDSYQIDDLERIDPVTDAGEDSDTKGPFSPAALTRGFGQIGEPPPTAQPAESELHWIVTFGDSDFVANSFYQRGGGAALFLNTANFLLDVVPLEPIRDRAFTFRELNLNRNEERFVRWSSWLFMPGLLALMAGLVWWVRR